MKNLFILFGFLFSFSYRTLAQVDIASVIQQKANAVISTTAIPGVLIGSSINGKHQFFSAGVADQKTNQPFTPDTQFEIGSISKTFTAFIVESVLRNKKMADTISIFQFLPDSIQKNSTISSIQVVELLNHTAGLPRLPDNMGSPKKFMQPYADYDKAALYNYLVNAKTHDKGKVNYSNLGVGLAGVIAENISNKSYEYLLQKYINKPFDLKNTSIFASPNMPKAVGYFEKEEAVYWDMNILVGAGGIKSDARDMLNYLDYMANHQSSPLIQTVLQKTAIINKEVSIAKGWHTIERKEMTFLYWHNGGTYGFSTFCAFNPTTKNSILVVINAFNQNAIADKIGIEIMSMLLN